MQSPNMVIRRSLSMSRNGGSCPDGRSEVDEFFDLLLDYFLI